MNENRNENKRNDVIEIRVRKYLEGVRKNPWIPATIVLAIALIIVILVKGSAGGMEIVSGSVVGEKILNLAKAQLGESTSLEGVEREGNAYKIILSVQGQKIPVLASLDGKYLLQEIVNTGSGSESGNTAGNGGAKVEEELNKA